MIEQMKKVTVLVSEKEREKFISKLRKAGVLHIRHVKAPAHHEINFIEDKLSRIGRLISVLAPYAGKGAQDRQASSHERGILAKVDGIIDACREKQDLVADIRETLRRIEWFKPWGEFDPEDLVALKEKNIRIRLYRLRKEELKKLGKSRKYRLVKREKGYAYIVTVTREAEEEMPFAEAIVPPMSPEKMRERIKQSNSRIAEIDRFLKKEAAGLYAMKKCEEKLRKEHESLAVMFGMQEEGKFSYLQGFCPAKASGKISSMVQQHGLGYLIEDPDNPDETPTLITNPGWIKIINPVFQFMNTLPGYSEFDISFYFLVFFSLFFAMLIGDAGYGFLFLAMTFLARLRLRDLPSEPFFLMYILSGGTIIWGAITGTWFGVERISQLPFFSSLVIEKIGSFTDSQNFVIFLCFVIGVVQLTIAHVLKGIRVINSVLALAEAGWILILWGMFFAAGKFVIARPFPPAAGWLLVGGISLVLLFSNLQKGIFKGALITLANLPLSVISSFSDIVSYLRLFAVGYATVIVADSFNNMALAGGVNSIIGGLGAAIILFLGHVLNIILGFMAVIVHGIRLNMLEFSSHLGMQWSGKKYEPFCE
jgi:V/A-type H+-transporting ATPase subunit I